MSAAHCIAARALVEDVCNCSVIHNAQNVELTMRLNARYPSMVRTSLSVHARLMPVQALRHKREATESSANQDVWTRQVAERFMLKVLNADAEPQQASSREAAPGQVPEAAGAALPEPPVPNAAAADTITLSE